MLPSPAGAELDLQSKLHEVVSKELNELSATIAAALSLELVPYFERLNLEKDSLAAEVRRLSEVDRTSRSTAVLAKARRHDHPSGKGPKARHLQGSEPAGLAFAQDEEARAQQSESKLRNKVQWDGSEAEADGAADGLEAEDRYESLGELTRVFRALCRGDKTSITVDEIIDMSDSQGFACPTEACCPVDTRRARLTDALKALNQKLAIMPTPESPERDVEICLSTFIGMMQPKDEFAQGLDGEVLSSAGEIRNILIQADAFRVISKFTNTTGQEVSSASSSQLTGHVSFMDRFMLFLDPFIGVVILLNALCISISTDVAPDAEAWMWLEGTFTVIFVAEFLIKLVGHGPCEFFLGADLAWNWFDGILCAIAAIDLVFTMIGSLVSLRNFTFIRLLRFLRLTRLVRVLQLKMFKELSLMVGGLIAGMRVLCWAMIFLGFILFSIGVLTTRTVGKTTPAYWQSICDPLLGTEEYQACERSTEHLREVYAELFGNVYRSTFTVFRCFMGDCSSSDGTPLIPLFFNTHGILVVIGFMVTTLFVNFGLFNLIMAIFVENTLEHAKHVTATRRKAKYREDVLIAVRLQRLVVAFCGGEHVPSKAEQQGLSRWRRFVAWVQGQPSTAEASEEGFGTSSLPPESLLTSVSKRAFNRALGRRDVQDMFEQLDIDVASRPGLFDIIDGSGNGSLEVEELVQGILMLRGSEAKGDAVACLLAIRSVQKSIKALEALGARHHQTIQRIEAEQQSLSGLKVGSSRWAAEGAPEGAAGAAELQDALGGSQSRSAGAAPEDATSSEAAADTMDLPQEVQAALAERGLPPSAARLKRVTPMEEVWTIDVPSSP